ncbi:PIN domain-containing protein [Cohnella faecalis]|uniref:hypothetical protein n=1 Tax=Cohnella faecalis TaxID=2315694 RepID=UPI003988A750
MSTIDERRLAVLIDADNVPYKNIKGIMEEIAKHGTRRSSGFTRIGRHRRRPAGKASCWRTP